MNQRLDGRLPDNAQATIQQRHRQRVTTLFQLNKGEIHYKAWKPRIPKGIKLGSPLGICFGGCKIISRDSE
ncbi:MAG TPA: hypothetical protein VHG08_26170 [Longimicrobium sp.]|nr:hypothetical protein [Longimicrobium sp.]